MGFLANLLPGFRDLRAPLVAGYVWLIGLYLLARDMGWADGVGSEIAALVKPLKPLYGDKAILLGATSLVAYLIGSLFGVGVARFRIPILERPFAAALHPLIMLRAENEGFGRPHVLHRAFWGMRLRYEDLWRLGNFLSRTEVPLGLKGDSATADVARLCDLLDLRPLANERVPDPGDPTRRKWWGSYQGHLFDDALFEVISALDAETLSIMLMDKEREGLWDKYDRQRSEGEFRLALTTPVLLLAVGLADPVGAWATAAAAVAAGLLYRAGDARLREANGTLLSAIALGLIEDPQVNPKAVEVRVNRAFKDESNPP